jgi:hypothetical protein
MGSNATYSTNVKKKQSCYRPEWPRGFQEVKVPDFKTTAQDGSKVVSLISVRG